MRRAPKFEQREMALLFQHEGVSREDASLLAETLARHPHAYAKTMVERSWASPSSPRR